MHEEVPHQDYNPMASRHDRQGPDQGYIGATLTKPSSRKLKTSLGFCEKLNLNALRKGMCPVHAVPPASLVFMTPA